jgi:hypothetical protein
MSRAISAHPKSQDASQQNGSSLQTASQQVASLHLGVPWLEQQSPAQGSPHSRKHGQAGLRTADAAQSASHSTSQQKESFSQTATQHAAELDAGARWGWHGSPAPGSPQLGRTQRAGFAFARSRHAESHSKVQQNGSSVQMNAQHWGSLHPAVKFASQQLPASAMPQLVAHRESASATHEPSQLNSQQPGSTRHTTSQHTGSLQNGSGCGSMQPLLHPEPHPTGPQQ